MQLKPMMLVIGHMQRGGFSLESTNISYLTAQARVHQLILWQAAKWACLCCTLHNMWMLGILGLTKYWVLHITCCHTSSMHIQ